MNTRGRVKCSGRRDFPLWPCNRGSRAPNDSIKTLTTNSRCYAALLHNALRECERLCLCLLFVTSHQLSFLWIRGCIYTARPILQTKDYSINRFQLLVLQTESVLKASITWYRQPIRARVRGLRSCRKKESHEDLRASHVRIFQVDLVLLALDIVNTYILEHSNSHIESWQSSFLNDLIRSRGEVAKLVKPKK